MKKIIAALGLILSLSAPSLAADTNTSRLGLLLISTGSTNWGTKLNTSVFQVIDSSAAGQFVPNTFTSSQTFKSTVSISGQVAISTTTGGNGNLRVRAGTGNGGGVPPILLYSSSVSSYTHAASGYMLAGTYTVPANTILNVGDQLRVFMIALATSTSQSKGIYCDFNGDDIEQNYNTTTNRVFQQTNWASYESANNLRGYALKVRGDKTGGSTTVNDFDETMAWTPTNDNAINCYIRSAGTGNTGVDADMVLIRMEVWLEPKP